VFFLPVKYQSLGCWKDLPFRAIASKEGDPLLDGHYSERSRAVQKCAMVAARNNWDIFAVQVCFYALTLIAVCSSFRTKD